MNKSMISVTILLTLSCGAPMGNVEDGGKKGDTVKPAGVRLTQRYLVANDGTRIASSWWYDSQLRKDCLIYPVDATNPRGDWVCIPPGETMNSNMMRFRIE